MKMTSDDPSRALQSLRGSLREWAGLATDLAKAGTLLSVPLGFILLVSYLHKVGALLPPADASTTLLILLVVGSYGFLSCFMLALLYLPAYSCSVPQKSRNLIRTESLFAVHSRRPLSGKGQHSEYLVFHGASILIRHGH